MINSEQQIYISLGLSILAIIVLVWQGHKLYRLDHIRKQFFSSGLKKDLEQVLVDQNRTLTSITKDLKDLENNLVNLTALNKNNIQRVGLVRFNPFDDAGGNMSFTLALLNNHDDGVIISSLHNREGTRIYSKSIKGGSSESKLTGEEIQAIKQAK